MDEKYITDKTLSILYGCCHPIDYKLLDYKMSHIHDKSVSYLYKCEKCGNRVSIERCYRFEERYDNMYVPDLPGVISHGKQNI